jgi:hypothetical protein
MLAELAAAEFAPRSVTVHFSRPLVQGAAEIQVETLRRGHHLATVWAHIVQEGSLRCAALATFGQPFPETAAWEADPPPAPSPEASAEVDLPSEQVPHTQHLRFRPAFGPPPLTGDGGEVLAGGWVGWSCASRVPWMPWRCACSPTPGGRPPGDECANWSVHQPSS